jgi:hypothetical protein
VFSQLYFPLADFRLDLLHEFTPVGEAARQSWSADSGARLVEGCITSSPLAGDGTEMRDAAWSLPHPLPEGLRAAEHVCFYPDKLDTEIDGERLSL